VKAATRRTALLLAGGGTALAVMTAAPSPCAAAVAATTPPVSSPQVSSPSHPAPPHASPRHPSPPRAPAHARRRAAALRVWRAPAVAPPAAGPAPVVLHTPGDAAAAGRRRLVDEGRVDEGFLLGLPSSGGPVTYLPPRPERDGVDPATATLASLAAVLAVTGGGALLLALRLRRPCGAPGARCSMALPPAARLRPRPERRPARLSRATFDRLPPLLQLALLDRSSGPLPEGAESAVGAAQAAPP
jgi:hypothetical protein